MNVSPVLSPDDASGQSFTRLRIGAAGSKGNGVFAAKRYAPDEVIEQAPVLVLPESEQAPLDQTTLYHYYFAWGATGQSIGIAFGFVSFANHSYHPNARYVKRTEARMMELTALREIEPDEEITINYNGDPDDQSPLWFEVKP